MRVSAKAWAGALGTGLLEDAMVALLSMIDSIVHGAEALGERRSDQAVSTRRRPAPTKPATMKPETSLERVIIGVGALEGLNDD
jgi:hypothetical protein